MRVTDRLADLASFLEENPERSLGAGTYAEAAADIRAALSHAAGQEVVLADEAMALANFFEGVRIFVTSRERIKRPEGDDLFDEHVTRLILLAASIRKLTPAQPPASAEVGRDRLLRAIQDEKAAWTGDYRDAAYRALDDMLARFDAAIAASSGRKGRAHG